MKIFVAFALFALATLAVTADSLTDERLAVKAEVVLRVKLLTRDDADKYALYRVQVLQVLKNKTSAEIGSTVSVAAYSWKDGVPTGESTLYLERYNEAEKTIWKLVGGEASTGVSNVKKP